jgi:hypothetical protein
MKLTTEASASPARQREPAQAGDYDRHLNRDGPRGARSSLSPIFGSEVASLRGFRPNANALQDVGGDLPALLDAKNVSDEQGLLRRGQAEQAQTPVGVGVLRYHAEREARLRRGPVPRGAAGDVQDPARAVPVCVDGPRVADDAPGAAFVPAQGAI